MAPAPKAVTVDLHSHFFPKSWPDFDARFGGAPWPRMEITGSDTGCVMIGTKAFRPVTSACWDVKRRLAEMDRDGIDIQVISATPVLFSYARPVDQALEVAKIFNDMALEMCAEGEGRLHALAQVPLQDIDAACRELSRAMKSGHRGVQIGNHVGLKNLDDKGLITFLKHCADEGAAVLVHPWDMMAQERMPKYMMAWTVGMPAETQLSIVAMILGGAFDRLPRSLRVCFAHGGGSFAFLLGRLENAWHNRDIVRAGSKAPPSSYCDRFFVELGGVRRPGAPPPGRGHERGPCHPRLGLSVPVGRARDRQPSAQIGPSECRRARQDPGRQRADLPRPGQDGGDCGGLTPPAAIRPAEHYRKLMQPPGRQRL